MRVRRIVDLSHTIVTGMPVYPGDPEVSLEPATTLADDGYRVLRVAMGSQSGTHVDAPAHFLADGAQIDAMALSMFLGTAVVVDLRSAADRSPIAWSVLAPHASAFGPDRLVLLHTGRSECWGTPRYVDHPYLSEEAAQGLVDAGVRTVGIDALSVDETPTGPDHQTSFGAHDVLLGAGCAVVENLTDLALVDWPDPLVSVLPLKLAAADGAPVRAVAVQLEGTDAG